MKYKLFVVREFGKNYFVAGNTDKRFLFQRLDARSLISNKDNPLVEEFQIVRNNSIIMSGNCYYLLGEYPVFWIEYSELAMYSSIHDPPSILFADDLKEGDVILSDVNAGENKAKSFSAVLTLVKMIHSSVENFRNGFIHSGFSMKITIGNQQAAIFQPKKDTWKILRIQTYIVPAYM